MHLQVAKLLSIQRNSSSGYLTLSSESFDKLIDGASRPYSVFVFGDALKFHNSKTLALAKRLKAFSTVAKTFINTHAGTDFEDKAVFVRLVHETAKDSFGRLGIKGLPYLVHIPPSLEIRQGSSISIPSRNSMTAAPAEEWSPVEIGAFVAATCGISPGDLSMAGLQERSRFLPVFVLLFLAVASIVGFKVSQSAIVRWTPLYIVGGLFVFWFSLSGGMYNIIRGVPLIGMDPRTRKPKAFMEGSGQMGAEGFIMGTLVMAFGMLVFAFTKVVPMIEDSKSRRATSYGIMVVGFFLFNWITGMHEWKSHLRSFFYF